MKNNLLGLILSSCLFVATLPAGAVALYLQPSSSSVTVGGNTTVDLMVSGISGMGAPVGLAAFAVELNYDEAMVLPTQVSYGTQLGTTLDFDMLTPSPLFVSSTSQEAAGFFAGQPDSFLLATITLQGLANGNTTLTFGTASLSDENGLSIPFTVPEPGQVASMIVVAAASGVGIIVRRLRRKS